MERSNSDPGNAKKEVHGRAENLTLPQTVKVASDFKTCLTCFLKAFKKMQMIQDMKERNSKVLVDCFEGKNKKLILIPTNKIFIGHLLTFGHTLYLIALRL